MIEDDLFPPSVTHVIRQQRPEYHTCHVKTLRAWHVLGALPCASSPSCPSHYGLCLPVSTYLLDAHTLLGVLDLDVEAIKQILPKKRDTQPAPECPQPHPIPSSSSLIPKPPQSSSHEVPASLPSISSPSACTVADLAAPKRGGRLPGGPDAAPAGAPQRKGGHRSPASNLFSLELMQTDDVSTIAAQIANQAELIYQAWKTTDLNPSELIHYHSVSSDRSSPLSSSGSFHSSPTSPPVSLSPRIPVRNISPAPPGSSPAIPRKIIDIPISTDKPSNVYQKQNYPQQQSQTQPQQHPQQQISVSPPHLQQQQQHYHQKPLSSHQQYQQQQQHQKQTQFQTTQQSLQQQQNLHPTHFQQQPVQSQSQQYPHQQHASSPARSLNASPRPYIPPASSDIVGQSAPQSPRVLNSTATPPSPGDLGVGGGGGGAGGSRPFSRGSPSQPPPPPERSSSYVDPQQPQQTPKQRDVLRELVTNFVMEDKARLANTRITDRPKSAPPSSIQDALNRFEIQMAITSRVSNDATPNHHTTAPANSSSFTPTPTTSSSPQTIPSHHPSKGFLSTRSDSNSVSSENWSKRETESRARRSISPNPVISQPGWNEPPPSNTSTWPLKNKQPSASPERRTAASNTNSIVSPPHSVPQPHSSPNAVTLTGSPHSTNYITTLEAHVDSQGRSPGVPIRHKVVAVSGTSKEEDRLIQALRKTPMIEDKDSLRPVDNNTKALSSSPPTLPGTSSSPSSSSPSCSSPAVMTSRGTTTSPSTSSTTSTSKSKKYSISVTVDVENNPGSPEPPLAAMTNHNSSLPPSLDIVDKGPIQQPWQSSQGRVEGLSTVDYAKVRFQDAQQRPKTTQRLEDFKSYSSKTATNGDGRVMQAKTRFETSEPAVVPEVPWRTTGGEEVGATLTELYRRKLRKMRKVGSPEPVHALASPPHPQLTDQQKAHIRERSQSPTVALGASTAVRPFLTQGSVAERVLLFEKAPTELKKSATSGAASDRRRPAFSTWRDPDEVRTKAQDVIPSPPSPPRPLEILPSSPAITANASSKPSHLREPLATSLANKENARPIPSNASLGPGTTSHIAPQSAPSTVQSSVISPSASQPSPLGVGGTGLASPIPTRAPGRRLGKTPKNILIPRFYYPMGRPLPQCSQEQSTERVAQCFREHGGQIQRDNMEPLMRACQLPLYWKAPLFTAAGGEKLGHLTQEQFVDYWGRLIASCHDISSRCVRILSRGLRNYLLPEDFLSLIQDVVDTHPGLTFLKEATEFHSRYVHTVIARIYYCVNRSWSGRITIPELRRSNLLQVISYLEEEEDINKITDYFSYEHFYVIYCKFWELDTDHDLSIDRNDLAKHNDRALSDKIIDRIFSGAVTRGKAQKQDRMGYQEFVWFLISEEDKRHPTAIEYWFRCMDLDGDGYLSMYELEYFYEDQLQRMEALGIEMLAFNDCICQMLDMVRPSQPDCISLSDLKKCRMTPVFFDTFFNFDKYLDHEQRDPFASHRMDDEGPEISDWDRYAAVEYELLVAEEGGGDSQDDMLYGDEDELSMGVDSVLDGSDCDLDVIGSELGIIGVGGSLKKHANLSATVPNLALDQMDVDEDYSDYADSDDY